MSNHLIVIDDTGSPGIFNESRFLKENRNTLVGVFIHAKLRSNIEITLKEIILSLNDEFGIKEIHLNDIVNKKNEYSQVSEENRLAIIMALSKWFSKIQLPYIVQTANEKTFEENNINLKGKIANFNLDKGEDQSLLLLLSRIKIFMEKHFPTERVQIIMDEGRKKKNQIEKINGLEGFIQDGIIKYSSSKEFILLQIADFFAYSINRTQITITKDYKTEFDSKIYEFLISVLAKQYSDGTSFLDNDFDSFTKDDYDYHQLMQRQIDGNIESWQDSHKARIKINNEVV